MIPVKPAIFEHEVHKVSLSLDLLKPFVLLRVHCVQIKTHLGEQQIPVKAIRAVSRRAAEFAGKEIIIRIIHGSGLVFSAFPASQVSHT